MKKGLVILLLLAATVVAQTEPIPRYSDFPLDNIHILRLQAAAEAISNNVSAMQSRIDTFEQTQLNELREMRESQQEFQTKQSAQLMEIEQKIGITPTVERPASYPTGLTTLLSINVLLLFIVIVLIIYLRGKYTEYLSAKKESSEHVHPAPDNLVDYVAKQIKKKVKLHDLRMELVEKGWSPSVIEHAIHAAKEA